MSSLNNTERSSPFGSRVVSNMDTCDVIGGGNSDEMALHSMESSDGSNAVKCGSQSVHEQQHQSQVVMDQQRNTEHSAAYYDSIQEGFDDFVDPFGTVKSCKKRGRRDTCEDDGEDELDRLSHRHKRQLISEQVVQTRPKVSFMLPKIKVKPPPVPSVTFQRSIKGHQHEQPTSKPLCNASTEPWEHLMPEYLLEPACVEVSAPIAEQRMADGWDPSYRICHPAMFACSISQIAEGIFAQEIGHADLSAPGHVTSKGDNPLEPRWDHLNLAHRPKDRVIDERPETDFQISPSTDLVKSRFEKLPTRERVSEQPITATATVEKHTEANEELLQVTASHIINDNDRKPTTVVESAKTQDTEAPPLSPAGKPSMHSDDRTRTHYTLPIEPLPMSQTVLDSDAHDDFFRPLILRGIISAKEARRRTRGWETQFEEPEPVVEEPEQTKPKCASDDKPAPQVEESKPYKPRKVTKQSRPSDQTDPKPGRWTIEKARAEARDRRLLR